MPSAWRLCDFSHPLCHFDPFFASLTATKLVSFVRTMERPTWQRRQLKWQSRAPLPFYAVSLACSTWHLQLPVTTLSPTLPLSRSIRHQACLFYQRNVAAKVAKETAKVAQLGTFATSPTDCATLTPPTLLLLPPIVTLAPRVANLAISSSPSLSVLSHPWNGLKWQRRRLNGKVGRLCDFTSAT